MATATKGSPPFRYISINIEDGCDVYEYKDKAELMFELNEAVMLSRSVDAGVESIMDECVIVQVGNTRAQTKRLFPHVTSEIHITLDQ